MQSYRLNGWWTPPSPVDKSWWTPQSLVDSFRPQNLGHATFYEIGGSKSMHQLTLLPYMQTPAHPLTHIFCVHSKKIQLPNFGLSAKFIIFRSINLHAPSSAEFLYFAIWLFMTLSSVVAKMLPFTLTYGRVFLIILLSWMRLLLYCNDGHKWR